jgi:hypothetical protein
LRIGITGARSLAEEQILRLSTELHEVLLAAQQRMRQFVGSDHPSVRAAYLDAPGQTADPLLRFISPLARGADRLAARVALGLGYRLHVPMPFPQAEYEQDFDTPEDLAEFRELLAETNEGILEIDGVHGPEADRAYEAVGRYVVRHCDLLIAIWDGGEGKGRGGTADIVRYAASVGVPVWWLNATKTVPPVWIADSLDLRYPKPDTVAAGEKLAAYLNGTIPPPAPCPRHSHGFVGWLARWFQPRYVAPDMEYFVEQPRRKRWLWQAYGWFMRKASGLDLPWTKPRPPNDPVAGYWFERFQPADARAGEYAGRYRSTYVWIFLIGTLVLILGASALVAGMAEPWSWFSARVLKGLVWVFASFELLLLLLLVSLVLLGMRRDWHERSIEYRLLAELYRKQQALAPLGWALPITAVRRAAGTDRPAKDRALWVSWLFGAGQRAAPLPCGKLSDPVQDVPRKAGLDELIAEQLTYHEGRESMASKAGHTLVRWGEIVFFLVIASVGAKLATIYCMERHWMEQHWLAVFFGFLATILPAISAALVGIRAYAELQVLAEESHQMAVELKRAERRIERLQPPRPLTALDLGAEAAAVATLMLQDLDGWARLFRVKGIEAG